MTFQFACRKWLSHKDLEPAGSDSLIQNRESMFLNLYISVICICFGFRYSDFVFRQSWLLYNCRGFSTNQLFFNKQSQFRESSNERKYLLYKGLSNIIPLAGQKNKPNSNPIKPNFQNAKMNINSIITKDYRKKDDFAVRKNKPNFQNAKNERKLICYRGLWEWNRLPAQKNKPKQSQFLQRPKWTKNRMPENLATPYGEARHFSACSEQNYSE